MTQHYTLEQAINIAKEVGMGEYMDGQSFIGDYGDKFQAALNLAITQRIGEQYGWRVDRVHSKGACAITDDPKLLEEAQTLGCKITPLYALKEIPNE